MATKTKTRKTGKSTVLAALAKQQGGKRLIRKAKDVEAVKEWAGEPGTYDFKMTGYMGVNKNGKPFVMYSYVCLDEEYEGQQVTDYNEMAERGRRTVEMAYEQVCRVLKIVGYEDEVDDFQSDEDLYNALELLAKDAPTIRGRVSIDQFGSNIRVLGSIDNDDLDDDGVDDDIDDDPIDDDVDDDDNDADLDEDDDDNDDIDDDIDDDDDNDDVDDDVDVDVDVDNDDDEDDEDDDVELKLPAKGDTVKYRPNSRAKLTRCNVTSVNQAKKTVTLKRKADNKIFKAVPAEKIVL